MITSVAYILKTTYRSYKETDDYKILLLCHWQKLYFATKYFNKRQNGKEICIRHLILPVIYKENNIAYYNGK